MGTRPAARMNAFEIVSLRCSASELFGRRCRRTGSLTGTRRIPDATNCSDLRDKPHGGRSAGILKAIQGDIAGLKDDMLAVKTELRVHTETFDVLLQEGRTLRGTISDAGRRGISRGEVEAIHDDLNRLRHEMSALTVRIDMIEERAKAES